MAQSPQAPIRGEHYARMNKELKDFLTEYVYPALEKNLDRAFPEFRFKKGPHGYWVASDAPVRFTGYGHRHQKLVATGWGFRSLTTGAPAVLWLSYVNRQSFPNEEQLPQAIAKLAAKVKLTYNLDPTPLQIRQTIEQERRNHFLEAFLAFAQGQLNSEYCKQERTYLSKVVGLPPNQLADLDLGFYPSPEDVREGLRQAGYETEEDDNFAENLGLFHPKWTGRIIGVWWDLEGRRVVNIWGRHPGDTLAGQDVYVNLNRPLSSQEVWGINSVPLLLHKANRISKKNLVLIEDPLKALLVYSLGLKDPFPISSCGPLRQNQVDVLRKYLGRSDTLILNMDYDPNVRAKHLATTRTLETLGKVRFRVHVVDPAEMAGADNHPWPVDASTYIKQKGVQAYKALLSRAPDASKYHSQKGTEAGGGGEDNELDPRRDINDALHQVAKTPSASGQDPLAVESILESGEEAADVIEPGFDLEDVLVTESAQSVSRATSSLGPEIGNLKEQLQRIAIKVLNDEITPTDAIAVLLDCQEGMKTLLSSLKGKVGR